MAKTNEGANVKTKTLNEWQKDMESKYAVGGCEDTRKALKIIRAWGIEVSHIISVRGANHLADTAEKIINGRQ